MSITDLKGASDILGQMLDLTKNVAEQRDNGYMEVIGLFESLVEYISKDEIYPPDCNVEVYQV